VPDGIGLRCDRASGLSRAAGDMGFSRATSARCAGAECIDERKNGMGVAASRRCSIGIVGCSVADGMHRDQGEAGMRTHLDKLPVTTIQANLPMGPAIAPGETSPLVVTLTDSNGKIWVTEERAKARFCGPI